MHKLPDLQPQQKQRKPLLIGQKMPKHDSYIRKVQKEHRILRRNHPHTKNMVAKKAELKSAQINLQHSIGATANLMKYTLDNEVDIICIQEPYIYQWRIAGIDSKYQTFTAGEARSRTAIIITNRKIDATLMSQLSDEDTITLEIRGNTIIILGSMYFDRQNP